MTAELIPESIRPLLVPARKLTRPIMTALNNPNTGIINARNEQTSGSDIDLVVEFEKNTPNLYDIKREIKDFIKSSLNLDADIAREKYIKQIYKDSILKETIYVD